MKMFFKWFGITVGAVLIVLLVAFGIIYASRIASVSTVSKVSDYDEFNIYTMDVSFNYNIDAICATQFYDDQSLIDAIVADALPCIPVKFTLPDVGCSGFSTPLADGSLVMGRNYDLYTPTSLLVIRCAPEGGYKSISSCALDYADANHPDTALIDRLCCLLSPYVCLDGMNEKGLCISIMALDSPCDFDTTDMPSLCVTLGLRLILDRTATIDEAVELLKNYNMVGIAGTDYHYLITDASGRSVTVEWDCNADDNSAIVVTDVRTVTNFYEIYKDKVEPNQYNGIYGHGKERYDIIESILTENEGNITREVAWAALEASSQLPKEGDRTSNTLWSIIYDRTNMTAEYVLRRDWNTKFLYDFESQTFIDKK